MDIILILISSFFIGTISEFIYRTVSYKKLTPPQITNIQMYVFSALFIYFLYPLNLIFPIKAFMMLLFMTSIEYITGVLYFKYTGKMLWEYFSEKWNYQGIICPKFSFYWLVIGLLYYFTFVRVLY